MQKVEWAIIGLCILIIISLIISDSINNNLGNMSKKIDSINDSLQLESEGHFLDVINKIEQSTVKVIGCPASNISEGAVLYVSDELGACDLSAGFSFNDEGNIITSAHGVHNKKLVAVIFDNGTRIVVNNGTIIENLDLSILHVKTNLPKLELESGTVPAGSSIGFIGFPLGEVNGMYPKIASDGTVAGLIPYNYNPLIVQVYVINGPINRGNSGGPVFSLRTGRVVGIVNQIFSTRQGMGVSTVVNQETINLIQQQEQSLRK
ncbi:trypsin-like peptidase domain-containing protein [Candidatus Micrarchaeota archaeon]|nr:trypsin-like peptidase domain-containing protein [Candidatus Micrarchaeota archaeon]